ncbi:Alpha/beta hydrolase fold-1 [Schizothecium vesticola]|uniref:Alpha/beta hydrolase fold-1 n=1 Tax=Schizothecium vesticola TaxID=314040 RepID=A0AA40KDA7_9PEZI|nr:Alpha/beta hydrolase fold-1 [Schizothecium vesticola]
MPPSKPTLIFVPGAWFPSSSWDPVTALLASPPHNLPCVTIPLPSSHTPLPPPPGVPFPTLLDDITAVRTAITACTSRGRDVVLVVHSYGAIPGHSAARGLTSPAAAAPGDGRVLGFAMLTTGFTATGVAFLEGMGGTPPPMWRADYDAGEAVLQADAREVFFHDLRAEEAEVWAGRLGQQALAPLTGGGEHAYAAWREVPVWYLAARGDRALPVEAQRMLVEMARAQGGDVTVREVEGGHAVMLSRPGEVAGFVAEAVEDFVARKAARGG